MELLRGSAFFFAVQGWFSIFLSMRLMAAVAVRSFLTGANAG
jgi:hypothetical protein